MSDSFFDKILDKIKSIDKSKLIIYSVLFVVSAGLLGFLTEWILESIKGFANGEKFEVSFSLIFRFRTWATGLVINIIIIVIMFVSKGWIVSSGSFLKGKGNGDIESVLENSRFMKDNERDKNFPAFTYGNIAQAKKDGVPVRAVINRKGELEGNFMPGAHSLIIGATGSGKTTTFVNPMIQLLASTNCGSSMIMTDPKGELFDMHSQYLKDRGYEVRLLDLRDTYQSSRWNPLETVWDMYQEYVKTGEGIKAHRDAMGDYPDLKVMDEVPESGAIWIEWNGRAYSDARHAEDDIAVTKQRIYDEMYEDLNDLISCICPIENEKDPLWEKGARSLILATCLAMLEDSTDSRLNMTKEKFNFYNINKILSNSSEEYKAVKEYFEGRSKLSQAVTLSRQVLAAADQTMMSYMSIIFDKLSLFNDLGLCGLTSATDIVAEDFARKPTALFMKIPDEKDTRHGLAALFILCMYKALIKVASAREDLSLPRNVYFILDEFGNMPRIEKFDKMITVGRSRKIWFNMIVQSYSQLSNVYGDKVADIVKSNCAMKMFIGSNDIGTCKEFSELCGNKTVKTSSTSAGTGSKEGDINISTQTQVRPLIYPSELQKLNNKESTGNAIIVTFGNYPLKTKYTPSYLCKLYKFGRMDTEEMRSHIFRAEEVFYDVLERNSVVLGS